jgi:hypothetical protein
MKLWQFLALAVAVFGGAFIVYMLLGMWLFRQGW